MHVIFQKIKNFFDKQFLSWLIFILAIDYLILFSAETFLLGLVTGVFSLNLFLAGLLLFVLVLGVWGPKSVLVQETQGKKLFFVMLAIFFLSLTVALYRAIIPEIIFFLILAFWGGKKLFNFYL